MSSPLGAVIDDFASERRELVAVNPPADDEPLDEVLAYFDRFDASGVTRLAHDGLPGSTLLATDGERTLAAADLADLHAYLFGQGDEPETDDASGTWPGPDTESGEGPAMSLTEATVTGIQHFLARLDNRVYTVTGETATPMVGVSRHIEQRALAAGDGVVHAGFQDLSRLRDERNTLETYRTLADRGNDVNLYGVADWEPPSADGLSVWADDDGDVVGDYWFVAVEGPDIDGGALVTREDSPGTFTGFWTFRPPLVADVVDIVESTIQPELRRIDG